MKSKLNVFKCLLLIIMSALLCTGCSLMDILFPEEKVETYGFSGYVYADGVPLNEAVVSCGLSEVETDDRGYYSFSNLTKVVEVSVSKEGYYFDDTLVYVKSNRNDVNFDGNKYFSINGIVKNGNEIVANATVRVESRAGSSTTTTNHNGNFYLSSLAGTASISASFEEVEFFTQECSKEDKFVTINSATEVIGTINCDSNAVAEDFVLKVDNNVIKDCIRVDNNNNLTFTLKNITPNSTLKIESENFYIENDSFKITNEVRQVSFNCEKFYDLSIEAISGNTKLENAEIYVNNNKVEQQTKNGKVIVSSLHSENIVNASLEGFTFNSVTANANNTNISLIGTFNLSVKVISDNNSFDGIKLAVNENVLDVEDTNLMFENVQLNSAVSVLTDSYFIENSIFEIASTDEITINLYRYYALQISVTYNDSPLNETIVTIGGVNYNLSTNGTLIVDNLYGDKELELSLEGYKFDNYTISATNKNIKAVAKKLFNLSGVVKSGNINLAGAKLSSQGKEVLSNENGEFTIEGLYDNGALLVSLQNYNNLQVNYEIDNENLIINLTYNVTGKVLCGNKGLSGVLVKGGEISTTTDENGLFNLEGLQGDVLVEFEKDYYSFTTFNASKGENLVIYSRYYIEGTVTDSDNKAIDNLTIILIDKTNLTEKTTTTNNEGKFRFDNLTNGYVLSYGTVNFTLKPNFHEVTSGGEYNFSNNGYGFGGRVMCGNEPVGNVRLTAGEVVTTTDEQGYFNFALITKPTTLTLYKEGYTFNNNVISVSEEIDGKTDINFNCSYKISGNILSLVTPIQNAVVTAGNISTITNEDGYYEISGLEGSTSINVLLEGYTFVGNKQVAGANTFNFKAYFTKQYKIMTGSLAVSGVELIANNKTYISDENGIIEIANAEIGISFTLSKEGYNFVASSFSGYSGEAEIINCSYNISGIVYSGINVVEGVTVVLNGGTSVTTNSKGEFTFNEIEGENTLSFELENFQFEDLKVNTPQNNLEVYAKYSVTGYVRVGNNALNNVIVSAGKFTTSTNGAGYFEINGLTTRVVLKLEKEGYEFEGNFDVNSPCELEFTATYMVCGFVTSGTEGVEGVLVTSSLGGSGVTTDAKGYYEIKGQEGIITLTYEKDGYETKTSESINSYRNNQNISLSYSVVINFSGTDDYSGIFISVNGRRSEYSQSSITLVGLEGYNKLTFSKLGYSLSHTEYGVDGYIVIDIVLTKYYSANFKVVTDSGITVTDAQVYAGTKLATVDNEGKYVADELSNKVNVFAYFAVIGSDDKILFSYTKNYGTIEGSGTYTITINNDEYAYFMFVRAYQKLRENYAYRITVNGIVSPQTDLTGDQKVSMIYKKVGDFRLYENLNYGKGAAGVEPRVSVLTYTDLVNKTVKYQMPKGDDVKSDLTANYSTNWTNASYQDYQGKYGISPEGFFPYNITNNTIGYASISSLKFSNNEYKFTMQFGTGASSPANDLVVSSYRTLMNAMVSKQTTKNYNYVKLTFTFDSNGNIKLLQTDEEYMVTSMSVTVRTLGKLTYNYSYTNNTNVNKLDISSNDAIRKSLNETLPENVLTSIANINSCVIDKRREIV